MTHNSLFSTISDSGENQVDDKISNNKVVKVPEGTYQCTEGGNVVCPTNEGDASLYKISDIHAAIICGGSAHSCVLDAERMSGRTRTASNLCEAHDYCTSSSNSFVLKQGGYKLNWGNWEGNNEINAIWSSGDSVPLYFNGDRIFMYKSGQTCGFEWDAGQFFGSNDHNAKFDCNGNADNVAFYGDCQKINSDNKGLKRASDNNAIWDNSWNSDTFTIEGCTVAQDYAIRIMHISGTSDETFRISGIKFKGGKDSSSGGGGLMVDNDAVVALELSLFVSCSTSSLYGGAILVSGVSTDLNLYTTSFDGNLAHDRGDDIFVSNSASLTVQSTCPPDWGGTPAAGSDLDTYNNGTLSGTKKSFDIG